MSGLLQAWVDHSVEARRLLNLCTRGSWVARNNYLIHMAKEDAIIESFRKSCNYWHMVELREKELNESRQEQASDERTEV